MADILPQKQPKMKNLLVTLLYIYTFVVCQPVNIPYWLKMDIMIMSSSYMIEPDWPGFFVWLPSGMKAMNRYPEICEGWQNHILKTQHKHKSLVDLASGKPTVLPSGQ